MYEDTDGYLQMRQAVLTVVRTEEWLVNTLHIILPLKTVRAKHGCDIQTNMKQSGIAQLQCEACEI